MRRYGAGGETPARRGQWRRRAPARRLGFATRGEGGAGQWRQQRGRRGEGRRRRRQKAAAAASICGGAARRGETGPGAAGFIGGGGRRWRGGGAKRERGRVGHGGGDACSLGTPSQAGRRGGGPAGPWLGWELGRPSSVRGEKFFLKKHRQSK